MQTQNEAILASLKAGEKLTQFEALKYFGCMRLASRINDLKQAGHDIKSIPKKVKTRIGHAIVAEYSMASEKGQGELF